MCRPNTANPPRSLTSKIGESFRLHVPALKVAHLPQQQSLSGTRLLASVCAAVTHVEVEKLRRLQVHRSLSALKGPLSKNVVVTCSSICSTPRLPAKNERLRSDRVLFLLCDEHRVIKHRYSTSDCSDSTAQMGWLSSDMLAMPCVCEIQTPVL